MQGVFSIFLFFFIFIIYNRNYKYKRWVISRKKPQGRSKFYITLKVLQACRNILTAYEKSKN